MTLGAALRQGTDLLERGGISVPRLTAEVLLAHALRRDRTYLYAHSDSELSELGWIHYGRYLHERLRHKPTQYITGQQEFFGRLFSVSPAVLIPRPETEHLIEAALPLACTARRVVDVGTGSGAIAITLALEAKVPVLAADISPEALTVAHQNARTLGATVEFLCADALTAFGDRSMDLIVSNPPYIALRDRPALQPEVRDWEPALALFAGDDGLDFHRRLITEAGRVLRPGGSLLLELGSGQSGAVTKLLETQSWHAPAISPDLAGIDRVLAVKKR